MSKILTLQETEQILEILVKQLGVDREQLTPDARLREDLGADSLDEVEIGMNLEEAFQIAVPDERLEQIRTVGDICETVSFLLKPEPN